MPRYPSTAHISRAIRRHRRLLAAALAAAAVYTAVTELRPAPEATRQVAVAARDLPAGTTLTSDDLRVEQRPVSAPWPGTTGDTRDLVGRILAVSLPAKTPITSSTIVASASLSTLPADEGEVLVPVRLADVGTASVLRTGDRVDVWAASSDSLTARPVTTAVRVAAAARVAAVPLTTANAGPVTVGPAGGLVVLAVAAESVPALARALSTERLTVSVLPN